MFFKELSVLLTCLLLSGAVFAQTTSISNSDLSKFRDRRISAEKEYRENYVRLGMPSPEEIEKDRVAYIKNTQELSASLRKEQAEREAVAYDAFQRQSVETYQLIPGPVIYTPYYGGSYINGGNRYPYRRPHWRGQQQIRWRAAGGFIFYEPGGRPSTIWTPSTVRRSPNAWRIRR